MVLHKKQRGYTMVLFLAFIVATLLAGFSVYDNGVVATEKIRIQNTTDATAYSTMTVLSRDMNFIAYTNRGMVGNQVAIAQMVGLSSWMHMLNQSAINLDALATLTYAFPPVGVFLNKITNLLKQATEKGEDGIDIFAKLGVEGTEYINIALSFAQNAFHLATAEMAVATFDEVSKANDKDVEIGILGSGLSIVSLAESWLEEVNYNNNTSTQSSNKDELKRFTEFAGVVNDFRDPFTSNRSYDWIGTTPIIDLGYFYIKMSLEKKGGSDFIQTTKNNKVQWEWSAMDTAAFWTHLKWQEMTWSGLKTKKKSIETLPVGWGAGHALNSGETYNYTKADKQLTYYNNGLHDSSNTKKDYENWGNGTWNNKITAGLANTFDGNNNLAKTTGINNFYSLANDDKKDTGPNIVAMLTKSEGKLRVQNTLDNESTDYNLSETMQVDEQGGVAGNSLYGLSKAETYFSRPRDLWARADGMREYGNLYNPFWQTRLVDNSPSEQLLAAGIQGIQ